MKLFTLVVAAALIGIGLGLGSTVAEFGVSPSAPDLTDVGFLAASGSRARIEVVEPTHDFGRVYANEERSFTFVLRNIGLDDLEIKPGRPSCKCTVSKISRTVIPPGEMAELVLTWKTGRKARKNSKSVLVRTNDPDHLAVRLTIKGEVTPEFAFRPGNLWLNPSIDEEVEAHAKLFFYQKSGVKIASPVLNDPETAEFFEVTTTPLSQQAIDEEKYARAGFDVHVRIKPGLPAGSFRQVIAVQSTPAMQQPMQLVVNGEVRSGIKILGRREWDDLNRTLRIGRVPPGERRTVDLVIQLSGKHRDDTTITVKEEETVPSDLRVTLGEPKRFGRAELINIPLTVVVPADARPVNFMNRDSKEMGRIVLETSHPKLPEIVIHVWFFVTKPVKSNEETEPAEPTEPSDEMEQAEPPEKPMNDE